MLLAISVIATRVVEGQKWLVNGAAGLANLPQPLTRPRRRRSGIRVAVRGPVRRARDGYVRALQRIVRSPGTTLRAMRDDPSVAAALGQDVRRLQLARDAPRWGGRWPLGGHDRALPDRLEPRLLAAARHLHLFHRHHPRRRWQPARRGAGHRAHPDRLPRSDPLPAAIRLSGARSSAPVGRDRAPRPGGPVVPAAGPPARGVVPFDRTVVGRGAARSVTSPRAPRPAGDVERVP